MECENSLCLNGKFGWYGDAVVSVNQAVGASCQSPPFLEAVFVELACDEDMGETAGTYGEFAYVCEGFCVYSLELVCIWS